MDPDFHRGDGVGPSPTSVIPAKAGNHAPPFLSRNQRASTPADGQPLRLAEARKGRGPRFSSGRRGRAPRHSPSPPVIPAKAGNHAPPNPQGQRLDSRRRPTPEAAEAWKGRGPRFSSGRRGRAIPHPSFRRKPETTHPPALRDSASTPADGQPLRQPKRGRDVDPDFHRGDGVGPPPTRHSGESRNPRRPQPSGTAPRLPDDGQPLS